MGIRVPPKSVKMLKNKLKKITGRSNAKKMSQRIEELRKATAGWTNYFGIADMYKQIKPSDEWLKKRIRMCFWKQWEKIRTRHDNLVRLGIDKSKAGEYANTRKGYWRISNSPILTTTSTNEYLRKLGFQSIAKGIH
jgi:hypothetical protein